MEDGAIDITSLTATAPDTQLLALATAASEDEEAAALAAAFTHASFDDMECRQEAADPAAAASADITEAAETEQAAADAAAGASITPVTLPADVPATPSLPHKTKKAAHPPTHTACQAIAVVAVQARSSHRTPQHSPTAGQQLPSHHPAMCQAALQAPPPRCQGQRRLQQPRTRLLRPSY